MRLSRRILAVIAAIALLFMAQGCAAPPPVTQLTASIYPVYCMLRQLSDGLSNVGVSCLSTVNAGCAHDYQITASDRRMLADSALVALNGAGMEPFLDSILPSLTAKIVRTADTLPLLPGEGEHGEFNPHTWLNPRYASIQLDTLADTLKALLPSQSEAIERNRANAAESYASLDAELIAALLPYAGEAIVTFHPAFEYFANAYGLTVAAVLTDDPDAPPSARELAKVIDIIRDAGIGVIFAERESDLSAAETVSRETGAAIRFLDTAAYPMEGVPDTEVYFNAMRNNLAALLAAFANGNK
ncbi:ABC transporter substrate-binding protein [Clostridia bacterium]|nr:ABC transporter substrate-binding protein [Clostridia bacterium]